MKHPLQLSIPLPAGTLRLAGVSARCGVGVLDALCTTLSALSKACVVMVLVSVWNGGKQPEPMCLGAAQNTGR